jgi:hypothetical protein
MDCHRLLHRKMSKFIFGADDCEYAGAIRINAGEVIMPQPRKLRLPRPPIGQRRCPACGLLMFLVCIEPTDDAGEDERTFECSKCAYAEALIVKFR